MCWEISVISSVYGNCLDRDQTSDIFFCQKRPVFLRTCAIISELPSHKSTLVRTLVTGKLHHRWQFIQEAKRQAAGLHLTRVADPASDSPDPDPTPIEVTHNSFSLNIWWYKTLNKKQICVALYSILT